MHVHSQLHICNCINLSFHVEYLYEHLKIYILTFSFGLGNQFTDKFKNIFWFSGKYTCNQKDYALYYNHCVQSVKYNHIICETRKHKYLRILLFLIDDSNFCFVLWFSLWTFLNLHISGLLISYVYFYVMNLLKNLFSYH